MKGRGNLLYLNELPLHDSSSFDLDVQVITHIAEQSDFDVL
jgi:hypothetical protein